MAISLIVMCSRLGGIIGTNVTAAMIYDLCEALYGLNFGLSLCTTVAVYFILRKCGVRSAGAL